jgi:hypothetical protein
VALALGGASQAQADAFLKKQEAFIDDQRHHLHEQLKQLSLGIWEKRLGMMLRLATLVVGMAVASAGIGGRPGDSDRALSSPAVMVERDQPGAGCMNNLPEAAQAQNNVIHRETRS